MTDIHAQSKPDTVLLLDIAAADPWTDYSQYRTDLVDQTTYIDESPSARTAIDSPREITLICDIQSGETGILLEHGNGVTYSYQIECDGSNILFNEGGSMIARVTLPGVLVGTDRQYFISWCQHADGSNVRSECLVRNTTSNIYDSAQVTHAATATSATDTLTVGSGFGGGSLFSDPLDIAYVRIGRRFHSTAEQISDWLSATTPPSMTQTRRVPALVPDRTTLTDLAADGDFVGPAHLWAGYVYENCDRRLTGAILNQRIRNPLSIKYTYDMPVTGWWRTAPGDSTVNLCSGLLWRRPVPLKCNKAYVRVWVRMNNSSSSTVAEARVRVYSLANLPVVGQPDATLKYHRTAQVTYQTDNGTTLSGGSYLTPGALTLAVDGEGYTWIAVGVSFDEAHAQIANTELHVHLVTVDPYHDPAADGPDGAEDP